MSEIKVRCIVEGEAKGQVMFTSQPIAFLQGVDPERGCVSDARHELYSKSFKGRILIFPNAIGSSVGAYVIYRLKRNGKAPIAIINEKSDIITTSGCAIAGIPLFDVVDGRFSELAHVKSASYDREKSSMELN